MKQSKDSRSKVARALAGFILTLLASASIALAQQKPGEPQTPPAGAPVKDVSGKYEGSGKAAGLPDVQITLDLKSEAGKLSGRLTTAQGSSESSEGAITDGKLSLKFGAAGKDGILTGQIHDEKVTGDWTSGAQKRAVELKKVAVDVGASLSGEWAALADSQGGFPFSLTLKVEGEKVTGSSSSQLGESNISSGSWKDGRLSFVLDSANGPIAMSATVVDGKLVGDFDFAGQLQGKWVATKKAP